MLLLSINGTYNLPKLVLISDNMNIFTKAVEENRSKTSILQAGSDQLP
jgi:hypothetical protein